MEVNPSEGASDFENTTVIMIQMAIPNHIAFVFIITGNWLSQN